MNILQEWLAESTVFDNYFHFFAYFFQSWPGLFSRNRTKGLTFGLGLLLYSQMKIDNLTDFKASLTYDQLAFFNELEAETRENMEELYEENRTLQARVPAKAKWVMWGDSESGDHYSKKEYDHKPTDQDKKDYIVNDTDEELPDEGGRKYKGQGDFGSCVHLTIEKLS